MPGSRVWTCASRAGSRQAATPSVADTVTTPSTASARPAAASHRLSAAAPMPRAWSSSASPVAVKTIFLPTRSNSVTPTEASAAATCRLRVGWVRPSLRAAADSEPVSAVSRNALRWFQSMEFMLFCIYLILIGDIPCI